MSHLKKESASIIFIAIATIDVVIFHALRDPLIFSDNPIYADAYNAILSYDLKDIILGVNEYTTWEKGYLLLNLLLGKISDSYELLFISTSIFMVVGFMVLVRKWSYIPIISIIVYLIYPMLFYQSLFVIRQHIAAIFILIALYYMPEIGKSLVLFFVAFSFHYSAIIFLPFYFMRNIKLHSVNIKKIIVVAVVIAIVFRSLVGWVIGFFPRFEVYEESENNIVPLFMLGSLLLMHIANGTHKLVKNKQDINILRFLIYGFLVAIFVVGLPGGGRLSIYFIYILPFAIPMLMKYNNKNNGIKILYIIVVLGLILYIDYLSFYTSNAGLEYEFLWS